MVFIFHLKVWQKIGAEMSLTFEFTGLRGFSRRSGGMMGWAALVLRLHDAHFNGK
jgi:hypothetical protein